MNIIEALEDEDLFSDPSCTEQHFRGASWERWRVFLKALWALPLSEEDLQAYRHHTSRQEPPRKPFREAALICGRRGGKSNVLALIAVYLAFGRDYRPYLRRGQSATIAILAQDRDAARNILGYVKGLIEDVPAFRAEVLAETSESITLRGQVIIEVRTASFRGTRGYTYAGILADELAFWRSEDSANPDEEVLKALRPGMGTIPGALMLLASSPYSRRGALWNAFRRHFGKADAPVLVWRGTTLEMHPTFDPEIVREAYAEDPSGAAAEYGAEFRDDVGEFVSRAVVDACTEAGVFERPYLSEYRYVGFVDPSGGSSDSMTLAIAHADTEDRTNAILDAVREVKPPFSPAAVVKEFATLLKSYGLSSVTGDRYAGEWPRERFSVHGIRYELSERSKGEIYRDALPLLNSKKLALLDLAGLTSQICSLERRTARGGRDSIDHPPSGHDDVANAAIGALLKAAAGRAPMKISPQLLSTLASPYLVHQDRRRW